MGTMYSYVARHGAPERLGRRTVRRQEHRPESPLMRSGVPSVTASFTTVTSQSVGTCERMETRVPWRHSTLQ